MRLYPKSSSFKTAKISTADATKTAILSIGTGSNTVTYVDAIVTAIYTATGAYAVFAHFRAAFNNDGGVLTRIDYISDMYDEADSDFDVEIECSGTNILVNVTGKAATALRWSTTTLVHVG